MNKNHNNTVQSLLREYFRSIGSKSYLVDILEERDYSYNDVFLKSFFIKSLLDSRISRGECIGLILTKPSLYMPSILACWQAGVFPAIIDNKISFDRLREIKSIVNFKYLLVDTELDGWEKNNQIIIEDSEKEYEILSEIKIDIDENNQPSILFFSSGTTGIPKCVPLSLSNIVKNIQSFNMRLSIDVRPVYLCTSPLFYAHGLYNSFISALISGGQVLYGGVLNAFNAEKVLISSKLNHASIYHITPSMIPILTTIRKKTKEEMPNFDHIICGTSKLRLKDKLEFENIFSKKITQQYGMTESLFMTVNDDCQDKKPESVGRPINCVLKIIDNDGNDIKHGKNGNIVVKSESFFGEYYNQKDETNLAYDNGWFKTGDLGILDEEGYLIISGRKKEIIKKGGFNINPIEIDDVIRKYTDIIDAATVGVEDMKYGEEIYSFIIAKNFIDKEKLDSHLRNNLQPRCIPKKIFLLKKFPKSESGKILTSTLKKMAKELCT
tara:strand:- start:197 stop:1684 length:1488 start_codon:yes stop_codon:yes gene_type:complete